MLFEYSLTGLGGAAVETMSGGNWDGKIAFFPLELRT